MIKVLWHGLKIMKLNVIIIYICSKNKIYVKSLDVFFVEMVSVESVDFNNLSSVLITDMRSMFYNCQSLITTITIENSNITNYEGMFVDAATVDVAQITVNYINDTSD